MIDKFLKFWNGPQKEAILYVFFGGLATVISISSFWLCTDVFNWHYNIAQIISWICAVAFAFFTNKFFVFERKEKNAAVMVRESVSFVVMRLISGVLEWGIIYLMVEVWHTNELLAKTVGTIFVIIANYFASKFLVFKKPD